MTPRVPDSTDAWEAWDARPDWHRSGVRRAAFGLIFVVFVFVVAPIVAMFAAAG